MAATASPSPMIHVTEFPASGVLWDQTITASTGHRMERGSVGPRPKRTTKSDRRLSVGDANWTLRRRSEQRITRSSAGEHSEKIRDLRTDLQPRVFIFVDGLYTRDGPIHFPGELLNGALVKRFVILVFVQRLHCLSPSCALADSATETHWNGACIDFRQVGHVDKTTTSAAPTTPQNARRHP